MVLGINGMLLLSRDRETFKEKHQLGGITSCHV